MLVARLDSSIFQRILFQKIEPLFDRLRASSWLCLPVEPSLLVCRCVCDTLFSLCPPLGYHLPPVVTPPFSLSRPKRPRPVLLVSRLATCWRNERRPAIAGGPSPQIGAICWKTTAARGKLIMRSAAGRFLLNEQNESKHTHTSL